jgi:Tfp pilus assembly protein PilX
MIHTNSSNPDAPTRSRKDAGLALPMVLVLTTAISIVVIALASYTITNLRYSRVTEDRSDRLSAADAGMIYAIDQLRLRNAGCILDTQKAVLPGVQADFNGASAAVTCQLITSGFEGIQAYAAVMTGEGLGVNDYLLSAQGGASKPKTLGGPVFMSRLNYSGGVGAFSLNAPVRIEDGPLLYHDTTTGSPCTSVKSSSMPADVVFEPELIFGPVCVTVGWKELFRSPPVPDLTTLPELDGSTDFTDDGGCRLFQPGRYTVPPATNGKNAYFQTGDYVMDFTGEWQVQKSIVTGGRINPATTTVNEIGSTTAACKALQDADPAALLPVPEFGVTIYFAKTARLNIATQGSAEFHTREQQCAPTDPTDCKDDKGEPDLRSSFVSLQALCTPNGSWCNADGDGGVGVASTLTATSAYFVNTDSGNNKELVAHALIYAPLGSLDIGNATNTAEQKMLGGLIVSRLQLQSSASASNFEIAVPTSPITAEIALVSTAVKGGETAVQAIVQYRPYEPTLDNRIKINSWRVCETSACTTTGTNSGCGTGDAVWTSEFWNSSDTSLAPVYTEFTSTPTLSYDWGNGSPDAAINANGFQAEFTRVVDFPSPGTYRFTLRTDDGKRLYVNGSPVLTDWNAQTWSEGVNTVDVTFTEAQRCSVSLELEYREITGQAEAGMTWAKLP